MIIIGFILSLLFSAFFSGIEFAYVASDKLRLELDIKKGGITAKILSFLFKHPSEYIAAVLVGNNIALVIYGLCFAGILEAPVKQIVHNDGIAVTVQTVLSTLLILFTGEFIPKAIAKANPNLIMKSLSIFIFFMYVLLYPITKLCILILKLTLWIFGRKKEKEDDVKLGVVDLDHYLNTLLTDNNEEENELETEVKIMQNALDFSNIKVRDCMVPRNEMVALEEDVDQETLEETFTKTGFSKIVIFKNNIDNIIGYIHSTEMFSKTEWRERIKQAPFVPESMKANKLMRILMQQKCSMAIVIDELGGTSGMVTLEDIVEEIFGEIEDEHDHKHLIAKKLEDSSYVFSGRMEIDEINDQFDLKLPENENFQTIAGFILYHHPRIPQKGEEIIISPYNIKVLRSSATKIELVKLSYID